MFAGCLQRQSQHAMGSQLPPQSQHWESYGKSNSCPPLPVQRANPVVQQILLRTSKFQLMCMQGGSFIFFLWLYTAAAVWITDEFIARLCSPVHAYLQTAWLLPVVRKERVHSISVREPHVMQQEGKRNKEDTNCTHCFLGFFFFNFIFIIIFLFFSMEAQVSDVDSI